VAEIIARHRGTTNGNGGPLDFGLHVRAGEARRIVSFCGGSAVGLLANPILSLFSRHRCEVSASIRGEVSAAEEKITYALYQAGMTETGKNIVGDALANLEPQPKPDHGRGRRKRLSLP
jgi:hypothetical protein